MRREKKDPLRDAVMKIFDPNIDSPDVFYKMEEMDGVQILRKYDKSAGDPEYAGTYEILYKTDHMQHFYLIMQRIANEKPVPARLASLSDEYNAWIVCEYSPGTHGRIYMKSPQQATVDQVVAEYEKKRNRRKKLIWKR